MYLEEELKDSGSFDPLKSDCFKSGKAIIAGVLA